MVRPYADSSKLSYSAVVIFFLSCNEIFVEIVDSEIVECKGCWIWYCWKWDCWKGFLIWTHYCWIQDCLNVRSVECEAHLLGNTGKYSHSCQTNTDNQLFQYCPTKKDITWSMTFRNWECLYYDSNWDIQWNLAGALGKSLELRPRDFPRAQAIFHRISLLLS